MIMYKISEYSGKVQKGNGTPFVLDDRNQETKDYIEWLKLENAPEIVEAFESEKAEKQKKERLDREFNLYGQRIKDGLDANALLSAELRLEKLDGNLTRQQLKALEKVLKPVRDELIAGQWITAKEELEVLGSTQIGLNLYNRLLERINLYILANYSE